MKRSVISVLAYGLVLASIFVSCAPTSMPQLLLAPEPAPTLGVSVEPVSRIEVRPIEQVEENTRGFLPELETALVEQINRERAAAGLAPLAVQPGMTGAARLRALEMEKNGYLAHRRPDGREWFTVLEEEFPMECLDRGETIAQVSYEEAVHPDAGTWLGLLAESPTQEECLLFPGTEALGVGIYYSCRGGRYAAVAVALVGTLAPDVTGVTNA